MIPDKDKLTFLRSSKWWSNSFILIKALLPKFLLPAVLFAVSNGTAIYSDSLLSSGLELGDISPESLSKLATTMILLSLAGILGLVLGLIALSLWMYELTALAQLALRVSLDAELDAQTDVKALYSECSKAIKTASKYFSATWMIGFLYLLAPVVPLSALIAGCILANSPIKAFGQHLMIIPPMFIVPIYLAIAFLSAIAINYTLTLTVLSANMQIKPRQAATLASTIILKEFVPLLQIDAILFVLDVIASSPFILMPAIPGLTSISRNPAAQAALQLWFALSSALAWPLTILIFAQLLKPVVNSTQEIQNA